MGVDNFEICLKNGGVYQAGQVIEGVIKLKISDEPFKISKGLKINVDGSGYYRVQSVTSRDTRRYGLEEYITETLYLLNEGDQEIPVGDQEFPFAYQLPLNLPSSLETTSSLGIPLNLPSSLKTISFVGIETVIRYSITATMPRTLLKDMKHEIQFFVIGSFDLNQFPNLNEPVQQEGSKDAGAGCFKAGQVNAIVRMSHRGFVPGEKVKVFADVTNESRKPIKKLLWKLEKRINVTHGYIASNSFSPFSSIDMFEIEKAEEISPGESGTWDWTEVCIPPTAPSNGLHKNGCEIFKIEYFLILTCVIPNTLPLEVKVPVEIGTVPLPRQSQDSNVTPPSISFKPGGKFQVNGFYELVPETNWYLTDKKFNPSYLYYNFN